MKSLREIKDNYVQLKGHESWDAYSERNHICELDLKNISTEYAEQFKPKWIPVTENLPLESGRYWCYVKEITDLGESNYQWNCYFSTIGNRFLDNGKDMNVTHWMPLIENPTK